MSERTVWITKYALTDGIRECTRSERWVSVRSNGRICVNWPGGLNGVAYFSRNEWHETPEAAQARAKKMAAAKLKTLDSRSKQRTKLEKIAREGVKVVDV